MGARCARILGDFYRRLCRARVPGRPYASQRRRDAPANSWFGNPQGLRYRDRFAYCTDDLSALQALRRAQIRYHVAICGGLHG